jgi:hypothetical protein
MPSMSSCGVLVAVTVVLICFAEGLDFRPSARIDVMRFRAITAAVDRSLANRFRHRCSDAVEPIGVAI